MMGKVIMSGIVPRLTDPAAILASELAVGSVVKLMENGSPADYLVVNQGIPSESSLYDSSCDGTWLLRKDVRETAALATNGSNIYSSSDIHKSLNDGFFSLLGSVEQKAVKQVKIPYVSTIGETSASGANGLLTKVFLLSACEVGVGKVQGLSYPADGAELQYFSGAGNTNENRIAYMNGSASNWWIRSPYPSGNSYGGYILDTGACYRSSLGSDRGVRPALVITNTAVFDGKTLLLKEVP